MAERSIRLSDLEIVSLQDDGPEWFAKEVEALADPDSVEASQAVTEVDESLLSLRFASADGRLALLGLKKIIIP